MRVGRTLPIQFLGPRLTRRGIDVAAGLSVCTRSPGSRKNRMEGTWWSVLGAAVAWLFPMWEPRLSSAWSEPKHLIVKHSLSKVGRVQPSVLDSLLAYPRLARPPHGAADGHPSPGLFTFSVLILLWVGYLEAGRSFAGQTARERLALASEHCGTTVPQE